MVTGETTVSNLQERLGSREQELEKQKEINAALETRISELETAREGNTLPETQCGEGVDDTTRNDLQATKVALAEALAKVEEDEKVVLRWEGKLGFLLFGLWPLSSRDFQRNSDQKRPFFRP